MPMYHAKFPIHNNTVFSTEQFHAVDDEAAIIHVNVALRTSIGKGHEIWQDNRLVHHETYSCDAKWTPRLMAEPSYEENWPRLFAEWAEGKIAQWNDRLSDPSESITNAEKIRLKGDISYLEQAIARIYKKNE
jgi:hypothetical protein